MADLAIALVYYGGFLIVVCALMAIGEGILERRDRRAARDWNRAMRRAR